jgi:serine/threonine-protein kinase
VSAPPADGQLAREDVVFGRAVIAFKLVARDAFDRAVAEYRSLRAAGKPVTLAQLMVARGLLTPEQHAHVVSEIQRLSAGAGASAQEAASALRSSAGISALTSTPSLTSTGGVKSFAKAAKPSPSSPAGEVTKTSVYGGGKSASDQLLRKKLKVPKEAATFAFAAYKDLDFLGEGAVGVVYRARDKEGHPVAIKAFASAAQSGQKGLRRFLQERRVFQGLDHPGLVKVHDVGIEEDVPFFTMDLVEGRTLASVLADASRPPRAELVAMVRRMCEAAAYLHERNIVLRDLKPENVMVRASDGQPVIIELGLAKDVGGDLNLTVGEGWVVTTPHYTPPEVQADPSKATAASDVFSLGVLLYQATCGKLPWEAKGIYQLRQKEEKELPAPPSTVDAASPVSLDAVCASALAFDPTKRMRDGKALLDAIDGALSGPKKKTAAPGAGGAGFFARLFGRLFGKK